jgi:hypothetical protein
MPDILELLADYFHAKIGMSFRHRQNAATGDADFLYLHYRDSDRCVWVEIEDHRFYIYDRLGSSSWFEIANPVEFDAALDRICELLDLPA